MNKVNAFVCNTSFSNYEGIFESTAGTIFYESVRNLTRYRDRRRQTRKFENVIAVSIVIEYNMWNSHLKKSGILRHGCTYTLFLYLE